MTKRDTQGTTLRQRIPVRTSGGNSENMVPQIELKMVPSTVAVSNHVESANVKDHTPPIHDGVLNGDISHCTDADQGGGTDVAMGKDIDDEDDEVETSFTVPLLQRHSEDDDADRTRGDVVDVVDLKEESSFSIALQVFLPFLIAGFGTVGAGLVLDKVQVKIHKCIYFLFLYCSVTTAPKFVVLLNLTLHF